MEKLSPYNHYLSRVATICMVLLTLLVILQPNLPLVHTLINYAEWLAVGLTLFGLGMVAMKQKRLMFASMLSAAAVCLYFDQPESPVVGKVHLAGFAESNYQFKIGHCNLSNHNGQPGDMLTYMRAQEADMITLLEYNAGWDSIVNATFSEAYPYSITRSDLGYKGMAVFSRLPIFAHDSLESTDARMYAVRMSLDNNLGDVACFLNMMPLTPGIQADSLRNDFMVKVKESINKSNATMPSLVLGEFSNPNWDNALRSFRTDCQLYNSRVGMMVTSPCALFPNFRIPSEHIFYSTTLECTEFQPIGNPHSDYIGLTGTYRIKPITHVAR